MVLVDIRPVENIHPEVLNRYDPGFSSLAGLVDAGDNYRFYELPNLGSDKVSPSAVNNSGDVVLVDLSIDQTVDKPQFNGFAVHGG